MTTLNEMDWETDKEPTLEKAWDHILALDRRVTRLGQERHRESNAERYRLDKIERHLRLKWGARLGRAVYSFGYYFWRGVQDARDALTGC